MNFEAFYAVCRLYLSKTSFEITLKNIRMERTKKEICPLSVQKTSHLRPHLKLILGSLNITLYEAEGSMTTLHL